MCNELPFFWIYDYVQEKKSPIHYAASQGHKEVVITLLAAGANIEAKSGDNVTIMPTKYA
jgi:ankyrin repeat protein